MKTERIENQQSVQVPQYEEYRTGNWLAILSQWLGGIGVGILALLWRFWPELLAEGKYAAMGASGLFLGMFLVPAVRNRHRSRENQAISRRNQKRYDHYRQSLQSEQEKKN